MRDLERLKRKYEVGSKRLGRVFREDIVVGHSTV
jgi:hypothetical protein